MTAPSPPLSRLYLIPAGLAVLLGVISVGAHLHQPSFPAAPGTGCIVTAFPGPDTLHVPSPYLELQACPHISETNLDLALYEAPDGPSTFIFGGTGPEDPRRWARFLSIHWLSADTVEVAYHSDVQFLSRVDSAGSVRIRYIPLP